MLSWPAADNIHLQSMAAGIAEIARYTTSPEMWANLNPLKLASLAACTVLAQCPAHTPESTNPPIVDLGYARYRGTVFYDDTVAYLGVPYA